MPRRRKPDDDEIETIQRTIEIDPQDAKVRKILASMPGGLKCLNVFRYPEGNKGGRPSYLDDISPEQFNFHTIKQMFGGGKFFVRWDNEDGTESKSNFDISAPRINFDTPEPVEDDVNPPQPQPQTQVFQPVQPAQQGLDPMMIFRMMQDARKEAREEMRMMMEMMKPPPPPPDMTKQVFEIVEKLAPMMGGDGGNSWVGVLSQFREPILKIVESIHHAVARPAVPPIPPTPHVQAHVQPNPPQQPKEDDMLKFLIRQYLPVFVNAARQNGNPDLYADMVLEQIPQTMYPKLEAWLNAPAWFEDVKVFDPVVIEAQAGWWNLLRASLLEGMKPDATTDLQPDFDTEHS